MSLDEEEEEAHKRASKYAPEPNISSTDAAVRAALIIGFSLAAFVGLAGMGGTSAGIPSLIVLAIGVGGTYFYYKRQENKYLAAYIEERQRIKQSKKSDE